MRRNNFWVAIPFALLFSCAAAPRHIASTDAAGEISAVPAEPDAVKLLRDVARAASSAGAHKLSVVGYGAATPGDRIESMVHVPKNACALFYSRATDTIEDLDLHVYGDDGSQFGLDESPDALPTLLLCPDSEVRLFVSARVAQGEGLVALGAQTVMRKDASAVARAVGARNFATGVALLEEPWPGLIPALDERRGLLGGSWRDQRRVTLPLDSRVPTHLTVDVPAERCVDALILPDAETAGLQLNAFDEKGRIFARGDPLGQSQALLLCAHQQGKSITLELRPYAGRGIAVAAISVSSASISSLDLAPEVSAALVDDGQPSHDQANLPAARTTKKWSLKRGEITSSEIRLTGCSRLDLIPDGQLLEFRALVWDGAGVLLAETAARRGVPLFTCATGPVRIDLEARERSGELTLELRQTETPASALSENPLAASRLLARAHNGGYLTLPTEIGRVTAIDISPTRLTRVPLSVPALHCQTIFIGAGHGAWGLDARIVDSASGLEVDRSIGRTSAQLRACAPRGGELKALLEIRTTSGATRALWAARQEKLPNPGE